MYAADGIKYRHRERWIVSNKIELNISSPAVRLMDGGSFLYKKNNIGVRYGCPLAEESLHTF